MATYLNLTNELLREMNEVELTSTNFGSAVGIQQHAKDYSCIYLSIFILLLPKKNPCNARVTTKSSLSLNNNYEINHEFIIVSFISLSTQKIFIL